MTDQPREVNKKKAKKWEARAMSDAAVEAARRVVDNCIHTRISGGFMVPAASGMHKPAANLGACAQCVTAHTEAAVKGYQDAHEKCIEEINAAQFEIANRENELHDEKDRKIADLVHLVEVACDHAKKIHLRPVVLSRECSYQQPLVILVNLRCFACGKRWTE